MCPQILKIDPENIDSTLVGQAAECLKSGGLVAFPTETVYGLGANALDPEAVAGIFEAKKRPLDDPLIVHIADKHDIHALVCDIPPKAAALMERFWPGPLTLILEKTDKVPDIVTTGLSTVAIRMPSNDIALELIRKAGCPVAAPSANLFGRPSPTSAQHVADDLNGAIDIILDGGRTEIGVESTVVEFKDDKVFILRPGGIDAEEIAGHSGDVHVYTEKDVVTNSPGKYPRHYSPEARVIIVSDGPDQIKNTLALSRDLSGKGSRTGFMIRKEHEQEYDGYYYKVLGPGADARACASELFHALRGFDKDGIDVIIAEAIPESGIGLAVMNRLRKAAGDQI